MRKTTAAAVALLLVALSACNTVKGAGEDITSVGQAGEDALDSAKD